MGGGVEVLFLVQHNFSIIPPAKHNFEHYSTLNKITQF